MLCSCGATFEYMNLFVILFGLVSQNEDMSFTIMKKSAVCGTWHEGHTMNMRILSDTCNVCELNFCFCIFIKSVYREWMFFVNYYEFSHQALKQRGKVMMTLAASIWRYDWNFPLCD